MTLAQLEKRLTDLEKTVGELAARVPPPLAENRRWWVEDAGRFADDPVFEEIVRLGREYRRNGKDRPGKKPS
jgi:hypothetical protein